MDLPIPFHPHLNDQVRAHGQYLPVLRRFQNNKIQALPSLKAFLEDTLWFCVVFHMPPATMPDSATDSLHLRVVVPADEFADIELRAGIRIVGY